MKAYHSFLKAQADFTNLLVFLIQTIQKTIIFITQHIPPTERLKITNIWHICSIIEMIYQNKHGCTLSFRWWINRLNSFSSTLLNFATFARPLSHLAQDLGYAVWRWCIVMHSRHHQGSVSTGGAGSWAQRDAAVSGGMVKKKTEKCLLRSNLSFNPDDEGEPVDLDEAVCFL